MLHAGLDLSRRKVDVCLLSRVGRAGRSARRPPDADALRTLASRIDEVYRGAGVRGGRVDDRCPARPRHARAGGLAGRDRRRAKGEGAGAAGVQDRQDRLAGAGTVESARPGAGDLAARPRIREERELARFRLHLVKHKSALKNRVHSTLINFGRPCPVTDLFGVEGRRLLARLQVPEPWRGNITARVELIDDLEGQIAEINRRAASGPRRPPLYPAADARARGSDGCSPSRSPRRSATSSGFPPPRSWPATPAVALASTSRATRIAAAR